MKLRKSTWLFGYLALLVLVSVFCAIRSAGGAGENARIDARNADVVRRVGLSDLCIVTDANYTRHPAVSTYGAAFQDSPLVMEHFPSGSLINPYLKKANGHAAIH
jgi:hypothetical protein